MSRDLIAKIAQELRDIYALGDVLKLCNLADANAVVDDNTPTQIGDLIARKANTAMCDIDALKQVLP
jgi:hypothetical protein